MTKQFFAVLFTFLGQRKAHTYLQKTTKVVICFLFGLRHTLVNDLVIRKKKSATKVCTAEKITLKNGGIRRNFISDGVTELWTLSIGWALYDQNDCIKDI